MQDEVTDLSSRYHHIIQEGPLQDVKKIKSRALCIPPWVV